MPKDDRSIIVEQMADLIIQLATCKQQRKQLIDALKVYGVHKGGCRLSPTYILSTTDMRPLACDCGLHDILNRIK